VSEAQITPVVQASYSEYPLVAAQPGIWIADQIATKGNTFAVAHYSELHGDIDRSALDAAIRQAMAEADTVQAKFGLAADGSAVQRLPNACSAQQVQPVEWLDFSQRADGAQAALSLMQSDLAADLPADGERPLYRQLMIRVSDDRWFWYQRYHHLMLDGFSFEALTRRVAAVYQALRQQQTPAPSPFISFGEVVAEYQAWQHSPACQRAALFWQQHTQAFPAAISLSAEQFTPEGDGAPLKQQVTLPTALFTSLAQQPGLQQSAPAEIACALLTAYLARISGENRLSIGFPFMRRMGSAALAATGPVVNVLPLQLALNDAMTLAEIGQRVQAEIGQVRRHQRYEAEQLRRDLGLVGSSQPLYGPVINLKVYHDPLEFDGIPAVTHTLAMGPVDDLEFEIGFQQGQLQLTLVANAEKYDRQLLAWHGERIAFMAEQLAQQPQLPLAALALMGHDEQQHLASWSQGISVTPQAGEVSILTMLQRQVDRQPDAIAVVCGEMRLTYGQLSARAMQLARELIARGLGAEDVVAIGIPRSVDSLVAIFGVLASGAAYMPLDLDYPRERLVLMCDDAQPQLLLTHSSTLAQMPPGAYLCIDDAAVRAACDAHPASPVCDDERRVAQRGDHLAYMIYTSGSTGRPKGVMSTHAGLLNLFLSHQSNLFGPAIEKFTAASTRRMRSGHTASFSFDSSWEPLFCMMMGCELHIFDEELRRDAWALLQKMKQVPVDLLDITPSFFSQMIDAGLFEPENHRPAFVMIGGEAATPTLWKLMQQHPELEIVNYYGPSEYTIDTLGASVMVSDQPVIGRPVGNTRVWLLDNQLRPVPVGCPGELYISGSGIARGYLRRPDLTAARFVANPFLEGEVMYRSGDLMRWRSDGQLAFIGRTDHQIKVRGFRIELGEVENALVALEEVSTAVVIAQPIGATNRLIGYCSVGDAALRADPQISTRLLGKLANTLPDYMVPAILMVMEELPLNVNGKIDRQALPAPQQMAFTPGRDAQTPQETLICQAVADLLGMERVGADDDFFALGGDSISAMGLGTAARRAGWLLRPRDIFAQRTPARMASSMQPLSSGVAVNRVAQQGPVTGLPILHWFNQHGGINQRFAHGVFLRVPAELQAAQLEQALHALSVAHPALAAFTRDGQLIVGEPSPAAGLARVSSQILHHAPEACAEEAFDAAVTRLDPACGMMMQAVLLQHHQHAFGLVLAIHHLVVDGVSWRVLLDELRQASEAALSGAPLALPAEETSLHDWSASVQRGVAKRAAELPFWQSMLQQPVPRLGRRALLPQDCHRAMKEKRTLLSAEQTAALLNRLPQQYRASVEETLLCALSLALLARFNATQLRYTLESHGRAGLDGEHDLARTVGWLTAEYPLLVTLDEGETGCLRDALRAVKSVLRAVPDRGIGYGQLCYLDAVRAPQLQALAQQHAPEVLFNYLGRFSAGDGLWTPQRTRKHFRDAFAVHQDADMPQLHALEVNIFVDETASEPRLAINWGWLHDVFSEADIDALHSAMAQAADGLSDFARRHPQQAADTLVAAEVAIDGVSQQDLLALSQHHGPLAAVLPLLPLQKGLLFHAQTADSSGSYNSLTRLSFSGPLDEQRLQAALDAVVRHHPQLAARFDSEQALLPLQLIPLMQPNRHYWALDRHPLPELSAAEEAEALLALEKRELARDLFAQPVMLHALLVQHGDAARFTLMLNAHHLVVDGWSTPVILRDLFSALNHGPQALTPHRFSYATIVRQLAARDADASRQLWQQVLQDVRPTLLFGNEPHDGPVHDRDLTLAPEVEQGLMALCRERGLTLNSVMQGIWALLLSIESGHQDVVFGSPVSGRFGQIEGQEQHVGLFSNTLPVRLRFDSQRPLLAQLADHQAQQIQLIEHDDLGLGEIQQLAGSGTLFDTLLVVENYPDNAELLQGHDGLRCDAISNRGYTHYPLTLLVLPGERLHLLLEYRDALQQPERFASRLLMLLSQLVAQPDLPLARWQLQTPDERALIANINNTAYPLAAGTLQGAIAQQVARTPDALALMDADHRLSYRQMQQQARLLADRLIDAGVQPGDIVAVALPRSVRLSLALTAILQAGAAWLPLDTGYPDERLGYMVEDARPRLIITESALQDRFALLGTLLTFDQLADEHQQPRHALPQPDSSHPAYVLYTSGSTGRPKGVVVGQQAIVNRLWWMQDTYPMSAADVVLQKTPCSFDVSVWEFFWPLMVGSQLLMAPPEAHRDPEALVQLIEDYAVTTMHFVPSMLAAWVSALEQRSGADKGCHSLQRVFCSGEALSCDLAASYQALIAAPLHNLYGPTEAAVDVTYHPASGRDLAACQGAGVPIGYPVWNTELRILDALLRPVPLGVAGDLYLCGAQLAEGYLYRADLTSQRFVADPFAAGERMYRTGDIARWLESGAVEYLGRSDDQLKIRGQRIELGEIEQALLTLPGVAQSVVAARELGNVAAAGADARQLVAWLIAQPGSVLEMAEVHQQLSLRLPAHMLPVSYVLTDSFPLSANGKLDRKALPSPQAPQAGGRQPEGPHETLLAQLFARLLELETVSADGDFFALGGHSLLAMRLAAELRRTLAHPLSIGQIMAARSVEKMARLLDDAASGDGTDGRANGESLPLRSGQGPALFCIHPASGFAWQYSGMMRHLAGGFPIIGLQSPRPDGVIAACDSVDEMCERHLATIRSVQPQGPYHLLGYSLGGTLAHGIAARLQQQGEAVKFLGLLDTYPPEGQDWTSPSEEDAREEVAREEAEFMAATDDDALLLAEKAAMFSTIVANYKDAVLRLASASSPRFDGEATLFVASKTLPQGMDVRESWAPYIAQLKVHELACEHMDILSPETLVTLGPLLDRLMKACQHLA